MTADSSVVGKVGRVTGRVAHGSVGEVMVGVRGGSEAFFAYPMIREAFASGVNGGRKSTSENGEKPAAREPAKRTEPKQ